MTKIQLSQNKIFTKKGQLKMLYLLHFLDIDVKSSEQVKKAISLLSFGTIFEI